MTVVAQGEVAVREDDPLTERGLAPSVPSARPLNPVASREKARGLGWVLRRSLLGIGMMVLFVAGGAWLLHASIEPQPTEVSAGKSE
jgi:hypothetical protein